MILAQLGMIREVFEPTMNETMQCYSACQDQLYTSRVSSAIYPTATTFHYTKEFCFVVLKLLKISKFRKEALEKVQENLIKLLDKMKVRNY